MFYSDCGTPPDVTNGAYTPPAATTEGSTVTYSCTNGYLMEGTSTATCQSNGEWATPPTCTGMQLKEIITIQTTVLLYPLNKRIMMNSACHCYTNMLFVQVWNTLFYQYRDPRLLIIFVQLNMEAPESNFISVLLYWMDWFRNICNIIPLGVKDWTKAVV